MKNLVPLVVLALSICATPVTAQSVTIDPAPAWRECAAEGVTCASRAGALVRYGAGTSYAYRIVNGAVKCDNGTFGDPILGTAKACAIASPGSPPAAPKPVATAAPVPAPLPAPAPTPTPDPIADKRERLGVNVAQSNYWSNEFTFANQAYGIEWLDRWVGGLDRSRLADDGMPLFVERGGTVVNGFLMPPVAAYNGGDTTTVCTWDGNADISVQGDAQAIVSRAGLFEFKWKPGKPARTWMEIHYSDPANRMRNLDCRLKTTPKSEVYDPSLLNYLKPFGTLRFLDWSRANSSPPLVTWDNRSKPAGVGKQKDDGVALEHMIGLANVNGSSPWFTVPWGADENYHRQMAQMVHDSVPAGRQVYVELSNEVWNYMFGQTGQAEREGIAAGLSDNKFQAALYRYAQKITEVMPIWADVFKDRPGDLVRIMATMSGNPWTGEVIMDWNKSAVAPHIDAIAIAPYFFVDTTVLTDDHDTNMRLLDEASEREIAGPVVAYKKLAVKFGKRLVAYEGGQHMIDPANVARREKMQRDPRMQGIYAKYLANWYRVNPDLFTLYAATGGISQYGAWGLREYAGQPIAEAPKLRGVLPSPH